MHENAQKIIAFYLVHFNCKCKKKKKKNAKKITVFPHLFKEIKTFIFFSSSLSDEAVQ